MRRQREWFAVPADRLAPRLLGQRLVRVLPGGTRLCGIIVEVEAYLGAKDRAAHTFNGRRTPRNEAMYGPPGSAYVYFIYGMHFCVNIVCGRRKSDSEAPGEAVLIRAIEPIEGLDIMRHYRKTRHDGKASRRDGSELPDIHLCSGPAKLCRALEITREQNGEDLVEGSVLFIERGRVLHRADIERRPRIGVDYAREWAAAPLRWLVASNEHMSS